MSTQPHLVDLSQLPPELGQMIENLVAEGDRNHVVATAILQAAGNIIGHHVAADSRKGHPDIDAICDRFVRRIAHAVFSQMRDPMAAERAARLGGGLH